MCSNSNKKRILYNDAVEEALCFGWIVFAVSAMNMEIQKAKEFITGYEWE